MYVLYFPCFLSVNFQWGLAEVEQEEEGLAELGVQVMFLLCARTQAKLGEDV